MSRSILRGHSQQFRKLAARRANSGGDGPPRWGRALGLLFFAVSVLVIACSGDSAPESPDPGGSDAPAASVRQGLKKGTVGAVNGDDDYCNDAANKCAKGEGDCDNSSQCLSGLVCINDNGPKFGLTPGSEACAPAHCGDGVLNGDEVTIDCSGPGSNPDCGTCLPACGTSLPPGSVGFCTGCICASGQGDCIRDADCQAGLVCSRVGTRFGFSPTTDVCVPSHCVDGTFNPAQGELDVDCGGECGACLPNCSGAPGGEPFCEGCRCQAGQGDCDGNEQCQRGLTCQSNAGLKFNLPRLNDACIAPHCTNGVLDSGETLVDCGGECGACAITDFDAGSLHACQVSLGSVLCWGSNESGQLGFNPASQLKIAIPTSVPGLPAGQALVTAGGSHSCAVSSLGVVKCWGANDVGQLGNGTTSTTPSFTPVTVSNPPSGIAQIVSGEKHVCVRTTAGAVSCWGANDAGQLGTPVSASQSAPLPITGLPPVAHLSAALNHTCAALTDGTVRCWGANDSGKLGNGGTTASATPVVVTGVSGATQVSTGNAHSCALKSDGTVYCWGNNFQNRLGIGAAASGLTPTLVQGLTFAVSLASAADSTCVAKSSAGGPVYCWGGGAKGQIGAGSTFSVVPSPALVLVTNRTTVLKGGGEFMCANTTDSPSVLRCWGDDNSGQLGKGTVNFQASPEVVWPPPKAATAVDTGDLSTCAVAEGKVYCWGQNDSGQIGDGTYIQRRVPTLVSGITNAIGATAGGDHACAVLADGTVRCWGANGSGQLGNGSNTPSNVPVIVTGVASAVSVEAGSASTCALLANGAISCWGRGNQGELGNGAMSNSSSPVMVNLPSATALSVGLRHACAIVNGNSYCWGSNIEGELGDGTTINRSTPVLVPVTNLSNVVTVVAIAAGHRHSCAIVSSGDAYCWGLSTDGQLGNYTSSLAPVLVGGIIKAKSISAWGSFTCAILETGQMKCWGQNARGQLGVGSTEARVAIPQIVPGVWKSVSAGGRHGCGLLTSGQIRCWGYNDFGQTGNGKAWIYPEGATAFPAAVPSARDSQCSSNADCSHGQVCWLQQGPRFDLPQGSNVCVNAECLSTPTPGCGTITDKCGKCNNAPRSCDGTAGSCHVGESCGVDNGSSLGLPSNQRGCWTAGCDDTNFRLANCGTVDSICGRCPSGVVPCTSDANCPSGQLCGLGVAPRFGGAVGANRCWDEICTTDPGSACGSLSAECGLCGDREPGCQSDAECVPGLACWIGGGPAFDLPQGTNVCAQPRCGDGTFGPSDCGTAAATCGHCAACVSDANCAVGSTCQNGTCGCAPNGNGRCGAREPCLEPADCQPGLTCIAGAGSRYGVSWQDVCVPVSCTKHGTDSPDCGSTESLCGICPPCTNPNGCAPSARLDLQLPEPENEIAGGISGVFAVSDAGTATYSIPIPLPPGRVDMTPTLGLIYDSSGRQELLGEGWQLTGFSYITRCITPASPSRDKSVPRRGIRDQSTDHLCLDGQQLVRVPSLDDEGGTGYATVNESFKRIRSYRGIGADAEFFKVWTPEGRILTYGTPNSDDGTVLLDLLSKHRRVWALTRVEDQAGNSIEYTYGTLQGGREDAGRADPTGVCARTPSLCGTTEIWPEEIRYTGFGDTPPNRIVKFIYDSSSLLEPVSGYLAGVQTTRTRLLNRINISIENQIIKSYLIENALAAPNVFEVRRVWECTPQHDDPEDEGSPLHDVCKKPTEFDYYQGAGFGPAIDSGITLDPSRQSPPESQFIVWDANADGHDDLIVAQHYGYRNLLDPGGDQWVQLSVQHLADDSLTVSKTELPFYQRKSGLTHAAEWRDFFQGNIMDVDGDGIDDLMDSSVRGQTDATALKGGDVVGATVSTSSNQSFPAFNMPSPRDYTENGHEVPSLAFIDVDGDGVSDAVLSDRETGQILWRRFVGNGFFAPAGEYLANGDGDLLFPVDLDGDGASDLATQHYSVSQTSLARVANWAGTPSLPFFKMKPVDEGHEYANWYLGAIPIDIQTIDINGDGLKDILVRGPEPETVFGPAPVTLYTNTGKGLVQSGHVAEMDHFEFQSLKVLDYDADGREDALGWTGDRWIVFRGSEKELIRTELSAQLTPPGSFEFQRDIPFDLQRSEYYIWNAVADVNGDGASDLVVLDAQGRLKFHLGNTATSHMLQVVTDGLGERTEVQYDSGRPGYRAYVRSPFDTSLNQADTRVLSKVKRPLVKAEFVSRRQGQEYTFDHGTEYLNVSARVDYAGRGWVGFDSRHIDKFNGDGITTDHTVIKYDRNRYDLSGRPICVDECPDDDPGSQGTDLSPWFYAFAGVPTEVTSTRRQVPDERSLDGFKEIEKTITYDWRAGTASPTIVGRQYHLWLKQRKTTERDNSRFGSPDERLISVIDESFDNDSAGNVSSHEVWTFNGANRVEHTVESMTFVPPNTDRWLLRLPFDVSATRTRGDDVGPDIADFSGEETTRSVRYVHNDKGQLTDIVRGGEVVTTTLVRDAFGNVEQIDQSADGVITRTTVIDEFDEDNIFPRHVVVQPNIANQTPPNEPPLVPHEATITYDARIGAMTSVTDTNGLAEVWKYDGFGRLINHNSPDGSGEVVTYEPSTLDESGVLPVPAVYKTTTTVIGGGQTSDEIDSFGRIVRTASLGILRLPDSGAPENALVVSERTYDTSGHLHQIARPHLENDTTQGIVTYTYNENDELLSVAQPDGTATRFDRIEVASLIEAEKTRVSPGPHDSFAVFRTDMYGAVETRLYDVTGELTKSIAADGGTVTYMYDAFGGLRFAAAPHGTIERIYDQVGRLQSITDPDLGFHEFTYTPFDEVETHTRPGTNGTTTRTTETLYYDPFGRLKRLENSDGVRRWEYDQATHGIGQLSGTFVDSGGIANGANSIKYTYDQKGRANSVLYHIKGSDYAVGIGYTGAGRIHSVDYPSVGDATFKIESVYDPASGILTEVRDAEESGRSYWRLRETYQGYLPHIERLGANVTTTREYFPASGLPWQIKSVSGGNTIQDEKYTFDLNHNLESRENILRAGSKQTFLYDSLNRIHQVLDATSSVVERFEYDPAGTGNITFRSGVGNYVYTDSTQKQPHGVKSTTDGRTYGYDDSGNQIARHGPRGDQTLKYALFGLPYEITTRLGAVTHGTTLEYDAEGGRLSKQRWTLSDPDDVESARIPESFRSYVGELYEMRANCGGGIDIDCESPSRTHVYRVYGGGREIAQVHRDEAQGQTIGVQRTFFLHDDQLGSTTLVTAGDDGDPGAPAAGTVLREQRYSPFGTASSAVSGAVAVATGFAGLEEDSAEGLVNMRGRLYDPDIGRFISPDPATPSADWSQGYNRYAYVFNNPLNVVDPFGFDPAPGDSPPQLGQGPGTISPNEKIAHKDNPAAWTREERQATWRRSRHQGQGAQSKNREQPTPGTSPAADATPHPDAAQPGSPDGSKAGSPQPDRASTDHASGRPGEGVDEVLQNSGNKANSSGPGSTVGDDLTALVGILNFQGPDTNGVSGGIPGGRCEGARCSRGAGVQTAWVAVTLFGNKLADKAKGLWEGAKAAVATARNVAERVVDAAAARTAQAAARAGSQRTVIGKLKDLTSVRSGENTLLKHLPDQGSVRANWAQNSGVLRREMAKGLPIRDASVNPATGELIRYPGSFLEAERNLLQSRGWTYNPGTTLWSPP